MVFPGDVEKVYEREGHEQYPDHCLLVLAVWALVYPLDEIFNSLSQFV